MGASASFYALVVASYSVGEAVGSLALGALSNFAGTPRTLQYARFSLFLSFIPLSLTFRYLPQDVRLL